MTKEELKKLNNGDPYPDIESEAQAVVFFFMMVVCAILVCVLAIGVCYGVIELVKWLMA